jgi:hypothetical protein
MAGHRMGHGDPAQMQQRMNEHHGKRLAELKTNLQLSPGQDSAWAAFSAAMQPPANLMGQRSAMRQHYADLEKLSTPERIDKMRALRTERMNRMNTEWSQREDAAKVFYATLTAPQKKVFDAAHLRLLRQHAGPRAMLGHGHHERQGMDGSRH